MNQLNTPAWVTFTYLSFGTAVAMMAFGIWSLPVEFWAKGYLGMSMVFLIGSAFTRKDAARRVRVARPPIASTRQRPRNC
jgi:hypothetical protein